MDIPILFEDTSFLVINKPAGAIVNKSETTAHNSTIQEWAEKYLHIPFKEVKSKYGDKDWKPELEFYKRGGIVHRLDKETSGALIISKTPEAFVALQQQFKERKVKKIYTALAHGSIIPEKGEISAPVGRLPWNRLRFGVLPDGRESITKYIVLDSYILPKSKERLSLVELYPQSGRTHQIRVHLQHIHHPIFSDPLYAGRKTSRDDRALLPRVFLHAAKISFIHPVTNKSVSFEAPLADELTAFLKTLS